MYVYELLTERAGLFVDDRYNIHILNTVYRYTWAPIGKVLGGNSKTRNQIKV